MTDTLSPRAKSLAIEIRPRQTWQFRNPQAPIMVEVLEVTDRSVLVRPVRGGGRRRVPLDVFRQEYEFDDEVVITPVE